MNRPLHSTQVGLQCRHLSLACHVVVYGVEKTGCKCYANQMKSEFDKVLMHRSMQGDTLCIPEQFGGDGKLYVEVIRTLCFMAKLENGRHCPTDQIWHRWKLLISFHLQGLKMILSECDISGVKSVGGVHKNTRHRNGKKWQGKSKWPTSCWTEGMVPKGFFVHLLMINLHTKYHSCICM